MKGRKECMMMQDDGTRVKEGGTHDDAKGGRDA
jgi:hypothetical protein